MVVLRRHVFQIYFLAIFGKVVICMFCRLWLCFAISVNMQGSLTLGKEVMEMLTRYVGGDVFSMGGRRAMSPEMDYYTEVTKSATLCENYQICGRELREFIEEYVIMLGKAIESIFDAVTNGDKSLRRDGNTIFGAEFAKALKEMKPVLKVANNKIKDDNEAHVLTGVLKKLSSKMQNRAHVFININIEGKSDDVVTVRKKLDQKIILALIAVEERYLSKLCSGQGICLKYVECTRALNILLKGFEKLDEKKTKDFVKAVKEALEDSDFYENLREETASEFQNVLNDMATTDIVQAKEVLLSVQKSVESRLNSESTNIGVTGGFDTKLINIILSDMDYVYSKYKPDPFHSFLSSFYDWETSESSFKSKLRQIIKRIDKELKATHDDIRFKLSNEVRVFLEITVE